MKRHQNSFLAYVLIGIGLYFLLKQLNIPYLADFYSWPSFLIIVGMILLIHSHSTKKYQNLFGGIIVLGVGIHFHGLHIYSYWIDHWAVYMLIIGIAFIFRYLKTNTGLIVGLMLVGISLLMIFSIKVPLSFDWIYNVKDVFEQFWPVLIICLGIYLLIRKR